MTLILDVPLEDKHLEMVRRMAWAAKTKLPPEVLIQDLFQDGCLGLVYAYKKHDPSRGAKFETYARRRVRGAILSGLRKTWDTTRRIARFRRKIAEASWALRIEADGSPTHTDIANSLGMTLEAFNRWHSALSHTGTVVVDFQDEDEYPRNLEEQEGLQHLLGPEEIALYDEHLKIAGGARRVAEAHHPDLVRLRYDDELTFKAIGVMAGCSESNVSVMHSRMLCKTRKHLGLPETAK